MPPSPRTCTGTGLLFVVPLPSWPALFRPQSQTVPSDFKMICSDPPPPHRDTIRGDVFAGYRKITSVPSAAPRELQGENSTKSPSREISPKVVRFILRVGHEIFLCAPFFCAGSCWPVLP